MSAAVGGRLSAPDALEPLLGGLLLPQSVLTSTWFLVLATMVAFNTIVYLGLTLSKFVPWPHQLHPDRLRAILRKIGIPVTDTTSEGPLVEVEEGRDVYDSARLGIVRRETPQALAVAGGLAILYAIASLVSYGSLDMSSHVVEFAGGVGMLLTSVVIAHVGIGARAMSWLWTAVCVVVVLGLLWEAYALGTQTPLLYSLVVITAFAPISLAWAPALAGGLVMTLAIAIGGLVVPGREDVRIGVAAVAALLVGLALLRARLSAIDLAAEERLRIADLASTDPLTGTLTRRGLLTLVEGLGGNAERSGQEVCVVIVRVADLTRANREYGYAYGDDVLRAVADVLRDRSRVGDLVARWTGDKFLVAGLGYRPDPRQYEVRVDRGIRVTGVDLGKWPVSVEVGTAAGPPARLTFEELVGAADEDLALAGTARDGEPAI